MNACRPLNSLTLTLTLTVDLIFIGGRGIVMDYLYAKFGDFYDFSFSRFGSIVRTDRGGSTLYSRHATTIGYCCVYPLMTDFTSTKLTIAPRSVVLPAAVCMTVDCLDCKSVRKPMSAHTGEGHTATRLIQLRHRVVYQRRRNTATASTYNIRY